MNRGGTQKGEKSSEVDEGGREGVTQRPLEES